MNRSKPKRGLFLSSLLFPGVFIASAIFYIAMLHCLPTSLAATIRLGKGDPALLLIEPGTNAAFISRQIFAMGLTANPAELSRWFTKLGIDRSIRPGIYSIRPGSPWEIAKQMEVAVPEVSSVTIIPGETFQEILDHQGPLFVSALGDETLFPEDIRRLLPKETAARIAFVLPDTYSVSPSSKSSRELVQSASTAWWKRVGSRIVLPVTDHASLLKTAIFASLVEKEAKLDAEREIIAGVDRKSVV